MIYTKITYYLLTTLLLLTYYLCAIRVIYLLTSSIRRAKCIKSVYSCIIEFFDIYAKQ